MCFSSPAPASAAISPATPPPAPAIPATQSASAAESTQQIGFARRRENKRRFGRASGPTSRRAEAVNVRPADTGSGIRM